MNAPITLVAPQAHPATVVGEAEGCRLAFLHIPKTAGTAFGAALAQRFAERDIAGTLRMALTSGAADPVLAHEARQHRLLGVGSHLDQDKLDAMAAALPAGERLFTVTVLRDPRARLVSQYRHWRRTTDEALVETTAEHREAFELVRRLPLGAFLAAGNPFVETHFRNIQARMIAGYGTSELMTEGELRATALANLQAIDFVGTTDTLDETLSGIAEAFGWAPPDAVRPLNVAPLEDLAFDAETEALIADFTRVDAALWQAAQAPRQGIAASSSSAPRYFSPDPALLDTLIEGGSTRFTMEEALDGEGWHVREGAHMVARWTGPARLSTIRLRTPRAAALTVALTLVSVLDWDVAARATLTLDGVLPEAPPRIEHGGPFPVMKADFRMPDAHPGRRELAIGVPFTLSHQQFDPTVDDPRQKGLAIGPISVTASGAAGPACLGALFWEGQGWSAAPTSALMDHVPPVHHAAPPPAERNLTIDLPLMAAILDLVVPDHVWPLAVTTPLMHLARGTPLAQPAPGGRLVILGTLFEFAARGAPVATLSAGFEEAVLMLGCAEDFRLRALVANPLLAPHLHILGCTNAVLIVNLGTLRRAGRAALLDGFLFLLERIACTTPEAMAARSDASSPDYARHLLGATLETLAALEAGQAGNAALLATLLSSATPAVPAEPAALRRRLQAPLAGQGRWLPLVDPELAGRLDPLLAAVASAATPAQRWRTAVAAQDCAFRLAALLAGWQHFGLAENATARLALSLRGRHATPPLYPKPLKPFGEYIDFYRMEARNMAAQPPAPTLETPLDRLCGGLDHIIRLNQAAREIEVALRLIGDRFPGEEILWVDAGCSYGVIMNAVVPPSNIRGRCSFLGFDFNAPAI